MVGRGRKKERRREVKGGKEREGERKQGRREKGGKGGIETSHM